MKTVFITGASSDIGLAVCRRYLAEGDHRIIAHFRTSRPELEALIDGSGAVTPLQIDFADAGALEDQIASRPEQFSEADVLINLVACVPTIPFDSFTAEDVLDCLRVNLLPGLLLMQAMGPAMAGRGWGRIIHGSSIGVKFGGGRNTFAYSLSKHAQEFIPRICRDWAARNVLTNVLRIGVTDTRLHAHVKGKLAEGRTALIPMGRMATPEEIAEFIFWLGSASNTYVTGEVLTAAGGE